MSATIQQPVVSPIIVGRDEQLAALDALVGQARAGRGATLLVSGEAGVGKSRLVGELRARFAGSGVVQTGHCFEHDRMLPFAPLLDLLRAHLLTLAPDRLAANVGPLGPELAKLLPELPLVMPDVVPSQALEPEQEQRRLFEALARLFTRLSEREPLLIVLEDLHWCDDVSLEFLARFARRIGEHGILLALTFRADEAPPALRELLGLLRRERLALELPLERLGQADVERMVRAIFQQAQPIRANFLRALVDLTDGNPFFIEEVLSALIASGDIYRSGNVWIRRDMPDLRIPLSVQDAVQRRVERLSDDARSALRLAAVVGQRFDFAVLAALTGRSDADLLADVRELIGAGLVTEVSSEQLSFRHALTREAVYGGLLARERRDLHRQIGETIERLYGDSLAQRLGDLAYHFHAAEAWEKTLDYARRAGTRELERYAPSAAVVHLTRAMEANERLGLPPSAALCQARGNAWVTLGEFQRARADYEQALECARRDGDWLAEWQALVNLGELAAGLDYDEEGRRFQQALDLAERAGHRPSIARSRVQLGNWLVNGERLDEGEQSLMSALEIFEELGDARGAAVTVDLLGIVSDLGGDVPRMRQRFEQAAALYRDLDDRRGLSSAYAILSAAGGDIAVFLTVVSTDLPVEQAVWYGEEALRLAREIGWRSGEAYAALNLALLHIFHGNFGRGRELAQLALAIARDIEHREWTTSGELANGLLRLAMLQTREAVAHMREAVRLGRETGLSHWTVHVAVGFFATALLAAGEPDEAAAELEQIPADLPMRTIGQRLVWHARAELELARGDALAGLEIIDQLYATAANAPAPQDIPLLAATRGACLMALGRHDEAAETLERTAQAARERGSKPVMARIHRLLADLRRQQGRHEQAAEALRRARAIIGEMAASLPPDEREAYLRRADEAMPSSEDARPATGLLTPREREVVILLAQGHTNREIAEALYVGPRTVETHVANVLNKLGFTSRTQIAAWAVEQGLAAT